jgi:hypothetical protein
MKLHENPSDGNRAVADGRTDTVKLLVAAHFVSSPKTFPPTASPCEWVREGRDSLCKIFLSTQQS